MSFVHELQCWEQQQNYNPAIHHDLRKQFFTSLHELKANEFTSRQDLGLILFSRVAKCEALAHTSQLQHRFLIYFHHVAQRFICVCPVGLFFVLRHVETDGANITSEKELHCYMVREAFADVLFLESPDQSYTTIALAAISQIV